MALLAAMKAYVFSTNTTIEPFGDSVTESFLGGERLAAAIEKAFRSAQVNIEQVKSSDELPSNQEFLVLPDTLFLTRGCIREFLLRTSNQELQTTRMAMLSGPATEYCRPLQHLDSLDDAVLFDLFLVRNTKFPKGHNWSELKAILSKNSSVCTLNPDPMVESLPLSRPGPPRGFLDLPRSMILAVDIRHWVHILWLNHLLPWIRVQEVWEQRPGFYRLWRLLGKNPYRRARRLNVLGKNCDIHPTAYIEGSILGNGVKLGPFTSVRDSILGDEVEISSHTKFLRCVVGDKCHTLNDSYFIGCTFYPESTLASIMLRNTILGRHVFITSGVMFWDEGIHEQIWVIDQGKPVQTGRWILGGCAGHQSILGTRAIFLPGRAVPNNTMIVMRPEEGITKLPAHIYSGKPYVVHKGSLALLEQALPEWKPLEIDL